jgi:hypothetical protein
VLSFPERSGGRLMDPPIRWIQRITGFGIER